MSRLENLLGAWSVAMSDRVNGSAAPAGGPAAGSGEAGGTTAPSERAALVTLLAHPGEPVAWLGDVLRLTSSGATRLVERLVAAGWVERSPGADARRRELRLTPAGAERARGLLRSRHDTLQQAVSTLSATERDQLERLLDRLVAGLAETRLPALQVCRLCDRDACVDRGRACPLEHTVAGGAIDV